jgi:hypothetical protein
MLSSIRPSPFAKYTGEYQGDAKKWSVVTMEKMLRIRTVCRIHGFNWCFWLQAILWKGTLVLGLSGVAILM